MEPGEFQLRSYPCGVSESFLKRLQVAAKLKLHEAKACGVSENFLKRLQVAVKLNLHEVKSLWCLSPPEQMCSAKATPLQTC